MLALSVPVMTLRTGSVVQYIVLDASCSTTHSDWLSVRVRQHTWAPWWLCLRHNCIFQLSSRMDAGPGVSSWAGRALTWLSPSK